MKEGFLFYLTGSRRGDASPQTPVDGSSNGDDYGSYLCKDGVAANKIEHPNAAYLGFDIRF